MDNPETQATLGIGHEDRHIKYTSQKTKKTSNTNPVQNRGLSQKKIEKIEWAINNGQSRDTGNTGHKKQNEDKINNNKEKFWVVISLWVFNVTFNTIIAWQLALLVKETEYPREKSIEIIE